LGPHARRISEVEWFRPDIVRIRTRSRFRSQSETIVLYPGNRLPSVADIRRRRRTFQMELAKHLCRYLGAVRIEKQLMFSDRRRGIGGAYPRFLVGRHAFIAVSPDESSAIVNGLMRAALLWKPLVAETGGSVTAIVPRGRHQCIATRVQVMPKVRAAIRWLQWDGSSLGPLENVEGEPETYVKPFAAYQESRSANPDASAHAHAERC